MKKLLVIIPFLHFSCLSMTSVRVTLDGLPNSLEKLVFSGVNYDEFISPQTNKLPVDQTFVLIREPFTMDYAEINSTGGEAPAHLTLTPIPSELGAVYEVQYSIGIPVGEWTHTRIIGILNNSNQIGFIEFWLAHLPCDINQSGGVSDKDWQHLVKLDLQANPRTFDPTKEDWFSFLVKLLIQSENLFLYDINGDGILTSTDYDAYSDLKSDASDYSCYQTRLPEKPISNQIKE